MSISRAHKIRIYPNKGQEELLNKTVGTCRFAYNWAVDRNEEAYKNGERLDGYTLSRLWTKERPEWALEVPRGPQSKAILNMYGALKNCWKYHKHKPKHHKKGVNDSFCLDNQKAKITGDRIFLQKIGSIKMAEKLRYNPCRIVSYNVSKKCNKWYVSVNVEIEDNRKQPPDSIVGVDVGIKHWLVASDGTVLDAPRSLKHYERVLRRMHRTADRKKRGSNNQRKVYKKLARVYNKVSNIKRDAVHKFTTTLAKNHSQVVIETLNIEGMKQGVKSIRRGVQSACMGIIHKQLSYKFSEVIKADRFFPSSKTCSNCGNIKADLTLCDRSYRCPSCGIAIDRDMNAAVNLRNWGLLKLSTEGHSVKDCGDLVKA